MHPAPALRFVAYYRVSTQAQGRSGLGLDAQKVAVANHVSSVTGELVDAYEEVESGKVNDRPALARALAACRSLKATLIIAKLDRLARNSAFLLSVVEGSGKGGVVFCDLPQVPRGPQGKFVIAIMAAVAELEAGLISERTKAALAAAKERGVKLGNPDPASLAAAAELGREANRRAADQHAATLLPLVHQLRDQAGLTTLRALADELNARQVRTARGGAWHSSTVRNLLAREQLSLPLGGSSENIFGTSETSAIKTASWFTRLPEDHLRIGISRGVPRGQTAGTYRVFRRLAPGPWFNSVSAAEYVQRYQAEVLDQLDPQETADQLLELAGGRVPVLVCYERAGGSQWCHRSLAAEWLSQAIGPVHELGHEGLNRHPLAPPL